MRLKSHFRLIAVVLAVLVVLTLFFHKDPCSVTREEREVRGNSLEEILPAGRMVTLSHDYYKCNEPQRGEFAAYQAPGHEEPVVKIVKGVPGDRFSILKENDNSHLAINGQILYTSAGEPYVLSPNRVKFLSLYVKQYKGVIPKNSYLLLGNVAAGSYDSILFGFITRDQLIGQIKVKSLIPPPPPPLPSMSR